LKGSVIVDSPPADARQLLQKLVATMKGIGQECPDEGEFGL
jgi:hypothetical protein